MRLPLLRLLTTKPLMAILVIMVLLQLASKLERFSDSQHVGRFVLLDQSRYRTINLAVIIAIKIDVGDHIADAVPRFVIEQQAPQNGLLGFNGVRRQLQR